MRKVPLAGTEAKRTQIAVHSRHYRIPTTHNIQGPIVGVREKDTTPIKKVKTRQKEEFKPSAAWIYLPFN